MRERIILAVDTSAEEEAVRLANLAKEAGAVFIKMGLELGSATSWRFCSRLAAENGLKWVADAKLDDIPNTVAKTVDNLANLDYPPWAITMHTTAGYEAMRLAQERAEVIKMLGVTVLTSLHQAEVQSIYGSSVEAVVMNLAKMAAEAGVLGVVASPLEVQQIKSHPKTSSLFAMIPGTRSQRVDRVDQARVSTPSEAISNGADLLVIGRQITQAENPAQAYADLVAELEEATSERV